MKNPLLAIISVLVAFVAMLFSIDTADVPHSGRSGRAYCYNPVPSTWDVIGDETSSVLQEDDTGSAAVPLTEVAATTGSIPTLPEAGDPLNTPPALLATSAMAELTPVQLPPLDAGMVNVTGGFDGNGQTAGYRVNPRPGEFAIAVPYDPSLLPQGFTEDDIQTYVYDRRHGRWVAIRRDSLNTDAMLVCSRFRPWEKGLPRMQNDMASPQDALAQVQNMVSFASQGDGGGDSPLDFINAVLKTPEMPEASAYTPTSIKELKAADPLEGLTLIQPPTANNSGTANLSYPIEIPAGRQGMQPNLTLTYSSSGGNGWLGVGWDIPIPSITVETRWGVPRYNANYESETYLLNGEQLATKDTGELYEPLSHQAAWKRRYADGKQFYPRVEGSFQRIIRHGDKPWNYWWEIQDKQGVTFYYGRRDGQSSPDQEAVLTDNSGNIAKWMLTEVRDLNGNCVKYVYQTLQKFPGPYFPKNIYPKEILYTLHDSLSYHYSVRFILQENTYNPGNNGRYGFLQTNNHLLKAIVTEFHKPNGKYHRINAYTFCYQEGMYGKALLQNIGRIVFRPEEIDTERPTEEDLSCENTKNLPTHTFEYYGTSDIGGLFGEENDITGGYDSKTDRWLLPYKVLTPPLGGSTSDGWSVGGALTVGFGYNPAQKGLTVGGNYMYSESESKGVSSLVDVDGDGLPDILFSDNNGELYYLRMQPVSGGFEFQSARSLSTDGNVRNLLYAKDKSNDWGLEAHATFYGVGASAAYSHSGSRSSTTTYLSDIDADGLPDIVSDGTVYYNRINMPNGGTDFQSVIFDTTMVGGSCGHAVVIQDEGVDENMFLPGDTVITVWYRRVDSLDDKGNIVGFYYVECRDTIITEAIFEEEPDFDPVRVWIAPYSGVVSLNSRVCLTDNLQIARFASHATDGVRASVQMNDGCGDGFYKSKTLLPDTSALYQETSCWFWDTTFHVQKGDRFYFRTESVEKRLYDKVVWDPTFVYLEIEGMEEPLDSSLTDADGKHIYLFSAVEDYLVNADRKYHIAVDSISTIRIESDFSINNGLSDNITLHVLRNGSDLCPPIRYPSGTVVANDTFSLSREMTKGDSLFFVVESPTNVRWEDVDWKLRYYYTEVSDAGMALWDMHRQYPDSVPNLLYENLVPHLTAYPCPVLPTNAYQAQEDFDLQGFFVHIDIPAFSQPVTALFSVKTGDGAQYQEMLQFDQYGNAMISGELHVTSGETYYLDMYSEDPFLMSDVKNAYIEYGDNIRVGLHIAHADTMQIFGPLYKNWGQFAYRKSMPDEILIIQDNLHISQAMQSPYDTTTVGSSSSQSSDTLTLTGLIEAMDSLCYNPANDYFQMMEPDYRARRWLGYGNLVFISRDTVSNTYSSDPDIIDVTAFPVPNVTSGEKVAVVNKLTETKNNSVNIGAQIPIEVDFGDFGIPLRDAFHWGYTNTLSEFMDMNGDGYPDVVSASQIQYSKPQGGLSLLTVGFQTRGGNERFEKTSFDGSGVTAGAMFTHSNPVPCNGKRKMMHSLGNSAGVNCTSGSSNDQTESMWADINGDGLPDRVFDDGSVLFNIGYTYAQCSPETNVHVQRAGYSSNQGMSSSADMINWSVYPLSGRVNLFETSIAGGSGLQHVSNRSQSFLTDLNGDGLTDHVYVNGSSFSVQFNKGYGFENSDVISFNNYKDLNLSHSYSRDLNVAASFGFTLACYPIKFVINPQFFYNWKVNLNKSTFADINGDGLPDYVRAEDEDHIVVRYNQSGKANLLKSVANLAGGSMTMDYELSKYAGYDSPNRTQVLSALSVHDGLQGDGMDVMKYTFEYDSAYYDRYERTSYGFGVVKTHFLDEGDDVYRTVTEKYSNRNYHFRGLKTYELLTDHAGNKYVEKFFTYVPKEIATGVVVNNETAFCFGESYPAPDREEVRYYEGTPDARIITRKYYEHGPFGNLVKYTDAGQVGVAGDSVIVTMTYHPDSINLNLTGMVDNVETRDATGSLLRRKDCDVDYNTGHVLTLRQYNNADTAVTDFQYDTFGNMVRATGPANHNHERIEYSYEYDANLHTFPVRTKNLSFGYVSSATYDPRVGRPLSTTDINGNVISYEYDWDGRMVQLTAPSDTDFTIQFEYWITYGDTVKKGLNPWARTRHFDIQHPDNPLNTTVISDGLGRVVQTRKDAEVESQEVSLVTGMSEYDCFGRVTTQYFPFADTAILRTSYQFDYTSGVASTTTYDVLDRQKHISQPHGVSADLSYGFTQAGGRWCFSTAMTDGMGNTVTTLADVRGLPVMQTAPDNTVTAFSHDALGQLTGSTDPMNLSTTYTYDMFGQLVQRVHPDAGTDNYMYDAAGNMLTHTNASNKTMVYRYDHNRLTDVEYPDHPANNVHYTYGDSTAGYNGKGRIVVQEDGSGWQTFKYGALGEVVENNRTFALPFENRTYTFKMQYAYDSYNRILSMTYPDGEVVSYEYNRGGMQDKVYGIVTRNLQDINEPILTQGGLLQPNGVMGGIQGGQQDPVIPENPLYETYRYPYIDSVVYDRFELKREVFYGNGIKTCYAYDSLQRLSHLQCSNLRDTSVLQNIAYTYDNAGNITQIFNSARYVNGLGGPYEGNYTYDHLYRLRSANGWWKNKTDSLPFSETMDYASNGRLSRKTVGAMTLIGDHVSAKSGNFRYSYAGQGNRVSSVNDRTDQNIRRTFQWDSCGNMTGCLTTTAQANWQRTLSWTEDNRLRVVSDRDHFSYYQYDASGERTCKLTWSGVWSSINGEGMVFYVPEGVTLYASPYLVITPQGYTKHYYVESERITSQLGMGNFEGIGTPVVSDSLVRAKLQAVTSDVAFPATLTGPDSARFAYLDTLANLHSSTATLYFYHTDHLGSSSWITTTNGNAVQHLHYLPWGEDFVDQRSSTFDGVRFTFSAKEKDTETGFSYFGSRYYSSDLSIWLSVDPMSDKYPSLSPYTYCANNPVKLTDPDGRWIPGLDDDGNVTYTAEKGDSYDTFIKQFDCRDADGNNRGRDIFSNAGLKKDGSEIKEGSVIKGDAVKQVTGNEVLKGNWNNMTDNQKAYQIKFAFDYGEKKNSSIGQDHTIDLNDFFHGFSTGYGAMKLNGVKIPEKEGNSVIMRTVNITIWPKDGLVNRKGQIPVYWSPQATGENYRMHNYYSAKNPSAGSKIPAITISY